MKALNDAYRKEKDPEKSTEIKDKMEPFYEEMGKITDRFIATHIDSYVTAGQLRYKVSSMTYPEAQAVFDRLSERVKKSKLGQEVYQEIQKLKNGSRAVLLPYSAKRISTEKCFRWQTSGENT